MNRELLLRIEEIFTNMISSKTGWGKNEILLSYKEAQRLALLELIDIENTFHSDKTDYFPEDSI